MFSLDVCDTDKFLDMPLGAQALYFHLGLRADDDGFVSSPQRVIKILGAALDEYKLLIAKGFIIPFNTGVCVITDWKQNNYLRPDRYKETIYTNEKTLLKLEKNNSYSLIETSGIPRTNQCVTQYSIGKDSIGKDSIEILSCKHDFDSEIKEILDYLNKKSGKSFRVSGEANKRNISARLKEGFKVDDFKYVIEDRCNAWLKNKDMCMYIRPATLFGNKFESYLNNRVLEKEITPTEKYEDSGW